MRTEHDPLSDGSDSNAAYPASYYAASANAAPSRPRLRGRESSDVCVVGAGFSGISTALALAERGYHVIVLEAKKVGWGASGRNGGQVINGYNRDLHVLRNKYDKDVIQALGAMMFEGASIIRERVSRYKIDCNYRDGNVFAALNKRQMRELYARASMWKSFGYDNVEILDSNSLKHHIRANRYIGGMLDRGGGHVHPLNLVLGEAAAAEALGVAIHEDSEVTRIIPGKRPLVCTKLGEVRSDFTVVCGNAYFDQALRHLNNRILPASTQIIATEPLDGRLVDRLMPAGTCVEDCNYVLDYYRMSADNRLLFGGGTVYGGTTPSDIELKLRPHLARTFPAIGDVRIEYAWSGKFALTFTRFPHIGEIDGHTYFAHGYSGHGVTTAHLAGCLIAEAICGARDRFNAFAALRNPKFPGGGMLRVPLSVGGCWYYLVKERLGL